MLLTYIGGRSGPNLMVVRLTPAYDHAICSPIIYVNVLDTT